MQDAASPSIYVVSDGRGETCRRLLQAAVVQFEGHRPTIEVVSDVRSPERVTEIVEAAARTDAVVLYTLVGNATRRAMHETSMRLAVPAVDVLGPVMSAVHGLLKQDPQAKPGLLYASEREDFDRQVAIDYTLKHDDGLRPEDLDQAHVVLVGVSRAAKSSTCFFLAYQGIKAANVPLLPGLPPPPELLALDPSKVIGLWVNPARLLIVRAARASTLNLGSAIDYLDREKVRREVREAHSTMLERGWRVINASYMGVEEIAREVIRMREAGGL
ncbi:MAG TPA: pyruvate, phosphate dikinase/phosphoenolpyruvate synthase regulator [Longimicrobiales bacterium]|nr:pyruvate, phosphate dikinase/phosphoenolpyruvate synthase regulator [Longimicrobiales bacterium]